ncbi:hypothetical protein QFC22_000576 [Naganishia vaughanmartiniae]|uniref:Uncharacterized protein n=1 Tax=Naganishia vaughanmartiniae TaxID=1424756 RepID=A0ACC2XQ82_9TREE|nr:hypothetical protein QFC22_000576 [Naganishia vaughanmartiniae]
MSYHSRPQQLVQEELRSFALKTQEGSSIPAQDPAQSEKESILSVRSTEIESSNGTRGTVARVSAAFTIFVDSEATSSEEDEKKAEGSQARIEKQEEAKERKRIVQYQAEIARSAAHAAMNPQTVDKWAAARAKAKKRAGARTIRPASARAQRQE